MHASLISDTTAITPSVIGALRALAPRRLLTVDESLRVARLQASTLLRLLGIEDGPVPVEFIDYLPHLRVIKAPLPVSGVSHWTGKEWIITVSSAESWRRQRATIAHEFKHIIDHSRADYLYVGTQRHSAAQQAEIVASYFAGCVLVPQKLLKQAWYGGMQRIGELADHFDVSPAAIRVRLAQTGIADPHDEPAHPNRSSSANYATKSARRYS